MNVRRAVSSRTAVAASAAAVAASPAWLRLWYSRTRAQIVFTAAAVNGTSRRALSWGSLLPPERGNDGIACGVATRVLMEPRRLQGSLSKLLKDPHDVFLGAIMAYDLPRVAELAQEDPDPADDPLHLNLLLAHPRERDGGDASCGAAAGTATDTAAVTAQDVQPDLTAAELDAAERKRASLPARAPSAVLGESSSSSPAAALLQSLQDVGMRALAAHEDAEAATRAARRAAHASLSAADKAWLRAARIAQHRRDALCAVNAILRTRAEFAAAEADSGDGAWAGQAGDRRLPAEDLAAVQAVRNAVAALAGHTAYMDAQTWARDFAAEWEELSRFLQAVGQDCEEAGGGREGGRVGGAGEQMHLHFHTRT